MAQHVLDEAHRCLNCKIPQCQKGCPISQDIPDWIHELSMGNLGNAMKIINDNMGENGWELLKNNFDNLHDLMLGHDREVKQTTHIESVFLQNEWKNKRWN